MIAIADKPAEDATERDMLVTQHLRLVGWVVNGLVDQGALENREIDEAKGNGRLALTIAAAQYVADPKGVESFQGYAGVIIRRYILRHAHLDRRGASNGIGMGGLVDAQVPPWYDLRNARLEQLNCALKLLEAVERRVLSLRWGLEDGRRRRLASVAAVLGLTVRQVREVNRTAKGKVLKALDAMRVA